MTGTIMQPGVKALEDEIESRVEVLYDVSLEASHITRCHPRSASFHNLVLMHEVFAGDILTDFPFIEASFGLSVAGVAL